MSRQYIPELGQACFGQPSQRYECSEDLSRVLHRIADELDECFGPNNNPFRNTGAYFKNRVFEAEAYSWNEDIEQPYNFKYGEILVSWYKYIGRGMSCNRHPTPPEVESLRRECLRSIGAKP